MTKKTMRAIVLVLATFGLSSFVFDVWRGLGWAEGAVAGCICIGAWITVFSEFRKT